MKIAIIGAGFTGLSAGYQLTKRGHTVTLFEKESQPGGLAIGYKEKAWEWSLEEHYHHWFTNDKDVLNLAREINHNVLIRRPKTSSYVADTIYKFDSPMDVLTFPKLPLTDRLRMAAVIGALRYNPFWKPLEKLNAAEVLPKAMGERAYKLLWEPLFHNKFGDAAGDISLAWFWARIAKRTPSLAYPERGFLEFASHLAGEIEKQGGTLLFNTEVVEVRENKTVTITWQGARGKEQRADFDKVIFTLPTVLLLKIAPQLPESFKKKHTKKRGLGATNLVLRLKKPFFKDNSYWLSVCDPTSPVMAVVEHTNFMDKRHYNNETLLYLGNYMSTDSKRFAMEKEDVIKLYHPFLIKLNPEYHKHIIASRLFKSPFAQPIIPRNYSQQIPPLQTPLTNVFLANMEQVYPWDRGTNYAIQLGETITKKILGEL